VVYIYTVVILYMKVIQTDSKREQLRAFIFSDTANFITLWEIIFRFLDLDQDFVLKGVQYCKRSKSIKPFK